MGKNTYKVNTLDSLIKGVRGVSFLDSCSFLGKLVK